MTDRQYGHLLDALLIGVATGGRTTSGLAALAWTTRPARAGGGRRPNPLRWFGQQYSRPLQSLALAGELVVDKLPSTPSRLQPRPLVGRVIAGATAAAALAQRNQTPVPTAVALGAIGTAGGSLLGARWRRFAVRNGASDLYAALAEDLATLAIASYSCRQHLESPS